MRFSTCCKMPKKYNRILNFCDHTDLRIGYENCLFFEGNFEVESYIL